MSDEANYSVKLMNRPEREAKIRASAATSTREQPFYEFRNEKMSLKVIRVPIDLPIYRTENFRTFTHQKEYTVREGKPANYFQVGQENESVQQLQHEILNTLARTGRVGSITPVIDVLRTEKQREPLLITHSGIMVNGNRRLAGMRELNLELDAKGSFSHVDCMVLPEDATQEDVVDIEASLQGKLETKLDYDWIGDCELITKLLGFGRTAAQVARQLNRKEKEIRNSIQALAEADIYLKDWVNAEGEYSRVAEDAEQLFNDLPGLLEGKDQQLRTASRAIAWTLFDNRSKLGGRLYAFNVAFGKRAADVLNRVASGLDVPLTDKGNESKGDDFNVVVEEDAVGVSYGPVIQALRDPERREEAIETLIDASQAVVESERQQKSGHAALKAVAAAHSKLTDVDLSRAAPTTYQSLGNQLDAVLKKATELKADLAKYRAAKPEETPQKT